VGAEGGTTPATKRWERVWYVDLTGQLDAQFAFNYQDAGLAGPHTLTNGHVLLYSETEDFHWTVFSPLDSIIDGTLLFELPGFDVSGYFTVGAILVPEPSTY